MAYLLPAIRPAKVADFPLPSREIVATSIATVDFTSNTPRTSDIVGSGMKGVGGTVTGFSDNKNAT